MTDYWHCDTCGRLPEGAEITEDPLYGTFDHEVFARNPGHPNLWRVHPVRLVREP